MTLEEQLGNLLTEKGQTIATAESCTGGLIGHRLTNVSGSSAYMLGGIIAYSNEAKMRFLKVKEETLIAVGAVSQEVAREMAVGGQSLFGADYVLSVTGIAGPSGGTPEKPVGLTYIGLATPQSVSVRQFIWQQDRMGNKAASADAALTWVIEEVS